MSFINLSPEILFDLSEFQHASLFKDCRYVWEVLSKISSYLSAFSFEVSNAIIEPGAYIANPEQVYLGKGSIVESGAYIQGPCVIGDNCQIRHGAYIRGNLIAGHSCVIGSEIKNSILLNHANAPHFNYVGDSILGNHVNLGAGVKCANLRLDRKEISLDIEGEKVKTGLRKFGAILGDNTQIGCNAVILPGTITGKNVFCHPCVSFGGIVAAKSIIKEKQ